MLFVSLTWGSFAPPHPLQSSDPFGSSSTVGSRGLNVRLQRLLISSRILAPKGAGPGASSSPPCLSCPLSVGGPLKRSCSRSSSLQFPGLAPRGGPGSFAPPLSHWREASLPPRPPIQSFSGRWPLLSTGGGRGFTFGKEASSSVLPSRPQGGGRESFLFTSLPLLPLSVVLSGSAGSMVTAFAWLPVTAGRHLDGASPRSSWASCRPS